jgi:hypothetical protein
MARKYGKKASKKVERAMHERKRGKLRSGRSGKKVKSRKQAIAIGLAEARKEGAKVPPRKKRSSKRRSGKRTSKRSTSGRSTSRRSRKRGSKRRTRRRAA